jgi:hypothetical protein
MGVVKDVTGSYTLGFVGLLAATAVCLGGVVWLLRTAPSEELRGQQRRSVPA